MRVGVSGERAQAPKSGIGPYEGPVALAYGPQPKQPVSPKDKHKIVRYFIMSGLESSPQSPRIQFVDICVEVCTVAHVAEVFAVVGRPP
jgi:hypothetical protein